MRVSDMLDPWLQQVLPWLINVLGSTGVSCLTCMSSGPASVVSLCGECWVQPSADFTGMLTTLLQEGTRFKGSFIVTSGRRRGPGHILCFATPVGQPEKQLAVKLFGSAADWQQEKALLEHPYSSDDLPGEQATLISWMRGCCRCRRQVMLTPESKRVVHLRNWTCELRKRTGSRGCSCQSHPRLA